MGLYEDAQTIIQEALAAVQPGAAVRRALERMPRKSGRLVLIAAGKAAWEMADAAHAVLGNRLDRGTVITKYGHSRGPISNLAIYEAGHPVPDEHSFEATQAALTCVQNLTEADTVLFLLSGGGSALFEWPLIPGAALADITRQLLRGGASIVEINTIRKRLSAVKGGKFAQACAPASVFSVVLSDILGDPLDSIASGPAYPDATTCADALRIAKTYDLQLSEAARRCLETETPKHLTNVETHITGSVRQLCASAEQTCRQLGYRPLILTSQLDGEAREAGRFLAAIAREYAGTGTPMAFIAGGETVVHVTGSGLGGRNQELALAAAAGMEGLSGVLLFSVGSDGTDGPTDAAGGWVDGETAGRLRALGQSIDTILADNDAYHALKSCGGLIVTGPTGTNVNDLSVLLVRS